MKKTVNELLALARGQLIGRYKPAILAVLLVTAINLLISTVIDTVSSSSTIGYIVLLAIEITVDLLFGVLILGECHFYLKLARFDETPNLTNFTVSHKSPYMLFKKDVQKGGNEYHLYYLFIVLELLLV